MSGGPYKPALIPCKCKPKYAYVYAGLLRMKKYFHISTKKREILNYLVIDPINNIIQFLNQAIILLNPTPH
jgi:hypothetical protein